MKDARDKRRDDARGFYVISGNVMSAVDVVTYNEQGLEIVVERWSIEDDEQATVDAMLLTRATGKKHHVLWYDGRPSWISQEDVDEFDRAWETKWDELDDESPPAETFDEAWIEFVKEKGGVQL